MAKKVLLIRHGDVGDAHRGRFIGTTDAPLSELGELQARALQKELFRYTPITCWASPLQRAQKTAACMLENLPGEVKTVDALAEADFGDWDNLTFEEICERDPELVMQWAEENDSFSFPNGERLADFHARISGVCENLLSAPEETIIVVAHGGVIRAMLCCLLGLDPVKYTVFEIDYGSISRLSLFGDGGVLTQLNYCPSMKAGGCACG